MITTAKQIHEIAKEIIGKGYDYDNIGLRVQESDYGLQIGQQVEHHSHHWDDGVMTDQEIDGICAVSADAASRKILGFGAYSGNVVLVIGSNRADSGEDAGEIILRSSWGSQPVILDIFEVK